MPEDTCRKPPDEVGGDGHAGEIALFQAVHHADVNTQKARVADADSASVNGIQNPLVSGCGPRFEVSGQRHQSRSRIESIGRVADGNDLCVMHTSNCRCRGRLFGFETGEAESGLSDNPLLIKRPAAGPKRCCKPSPLPPRGTTPWEEYRAFELDSHLARRSVGEAADPRTTDDCCAATDVDARWSCARTAIAGNSIVRMPAAGRRVVSRCGRPAAGTRRPSGAGKITLDGRSDTGFGWPSNEV